MQYVQVRMDLHAEVHFNISRNGEVKKCFCTDMTVQGFMLQIPSALIRQKTV